MVSADFFEGIRDEALRPASKTDLAKALTILAAETALRPGEEPGWRVRFAALNNRLKDYPADVALSVIRAWPEQRDGAGKWWPTWNELYPLLEERMRQRRAILRATNPEQREQMIFQTFIAGTHHWDDRHPKPTDAEIEAVRARRTAP